MILILSNNLTSMCGNRKYYILLRCFWWHKHMIKQRRNNRIDIKSCNVWGDEKIYLLMILARGINTVPIIINPLGYEIDSTCFDEIDKTFFWFIIYRNPIRYGDISMKKQLALRLLVVWRWNDIKGLSQSF